MSDISKLTKPDNPICGPCQLGTHMHFTQENGQSIHFKIIRSFTHGFDGPIKMEVWTVNNIFFMLLMTVFRFILIYFLR